MLRYCGQVERDVVERRQTITCHDQVKHGTSFLQSSAPAAATGMRGTGFVLARPPVLAMMTSRTARSAAQGLDHGSAIASRLGPSAASDPRRSDLATRGVHRVRATVLMIIMHATPGRCRVRDGSSRLTHLAGHWRSGVVWPLGQKLSDCFCSLGLNAARVRPCEAATCSRGNSRPRRRRPASLA
jgi:hypothetical protein